MPKRKSSTPIPSPDNAPPAETALLTVTGISPAILTETIWALATENIVPHRVIVITTALGEARLKTELLNENLHFGGRAPWDCLIESLETSGQPTAGRLKLDVRVIKSWRNKRRIAEDLKDIRKREDSEDAADFILDVVRSLVEVPDLRLIASIAGGRKTMGALLHSAMTLLARETDRVTHVLISEPFESVVEPKFFYPDQPCAELKDRQGNTIDARDCWIELTDVPFVPIRNLFERDLIKKPATFTQLVSRCRKRLEEISARDCRLIVASREPEATINGIVLRLSAAQYLLLLFLAERALEKLLAINTYASAVDPVRKRAEELYALHDKNNFSDWRYKLLPDDGFEEGIDERWITRNLADLRATLKQGGPECAALIRLLPQAGRFSLNLDPKQIKIEP